MTNDRWVGVVLAAATLCGCNKNDAPAAPPGQGVGASHPPAPAAGAPAAVNCGHAACGDSYFVDVIAEDGCASAARCNVGLKLTATGAFHVNDQYPYKFKAEATPAVEFLGTDPAGKNVFSKPAGDWAQTGAKSGVMTVRLTPAAPGRSTISGVFKLSVCSEQNCLIEQPQLQVSIHAS
jgi:hypothetical protein